MIWVTLKYLVKPALTNMNGENDKTSCVYPPKDLIIEKCWWTKCN